MPIGNTPNIPPTRWMDIQPPPRYAPDSTTDKAGLLYVKLRRADGTDIIIANLNAPQVSDDVEGGEGSYFQGCVDIADNDHDIEVFDKMRLEFTRTPSDNIVEDDPDSGSVTIHVGGAGLSVTDCANDSADNVQQINFLGGEITSIDEQTDDQGNPFTVVDYAFGIEVTDDEDNVNENSTAIDFRGAVVVGGDSGDSCDSRADVLVGLDFEDATGGDFASINTVIFTYRMPGDGFGDGIITDGTDEDMITVGMPALMSVSDGDGNSFGGPILSMSFQDAQGSGQFVSAGDDNEVVVTLPGLAVQGDTGDFVDDATFLYFPGADVSDDGDGAATVRILPDLPQGGTFVLACVDGELDWLDTTDCDNSNPGS